MEQFVEGAPRIVARTRLQEVGRWMDELMTAASNQTGFGKGTCIVAAISTLLKEGDEEAFEEVQRGFLALLAKRHVRAGGSTEIYDPEE
ncbi:hypothetical protein KZ820_20685 [Sphingomonas sp. RRHST34]|uniref:Uncharacterized protein n=1 Tax=Sphingomonas citri TaxID=2862499 RepID=A0ABS7BUC4_9SPHN|nr:hypothetical protein [Sphingomonas citri]MBW6533168.1 hypothetical protein [Sphingomonas citri]